VADLLAGLAPHLIQVIVARLNAMTMTVVVRRGAQVLRADFVVFTAVGKYAWDEMLQLWVGGTEIIDKAAYIAANLAQISLAPVHTLQRTRDGAGNVLRIPVATASGPGNSHDLADLVGNDATLQTIVDHVPMAVEGAYNVSETLKQPVGGQTLRQKLNQIMAPAFA
jgi:hypothetical protein